MVRKIRRRMLDNESRVIHNGIVAGRRVDITRAGTQEKGIFQVARDDWKYYDDDETGEEEGKKALPAERQCRNCLHWVERDTVCCPWCGKVFDEKERGRP